ncbi:MAG: HAD-IIA family hydrolase [Ruminococcaceae bacterium]|nr:HAD-IIA family hydrolase [Oscillospiraceae bacterium]
MTKALDSRFKKEQIKKIKCFVLDMDGTIYLGNELFEFTPEFLKTVKSAGKDYRFFTNNSSRNSKMYAEKLKKLGVEGVGDNDVCISNEVVIRYIKKNYKDPRVFVLGTPALIENFKARGIEIDEQNPNLMVLGFDTTLSYDRLSRFCQFVRDGVDYIGVNPDLNCPMEGGKFIPDCGSIARLVESSTGRFPEFFGKPSKHTLDYVVDVTGYKENEIAFVGDRLYTDIAVTENSEAASILVLTGEGTLDEALNGEHKPDLIMRSLEEITEILKELYL